MLHPGSNTIDICKGDDSFDSGNDAYGDCTGTWFETSQTTTFAWDEAISQIQDQSYYSLSKFSLSNSVGL